MNVRKIVLTALEKMEKNSGYSNLLLNSVLKEQELSDFERRFASNIFYGVIERKLTLDYIIGQLSSRGKQKISSYVLNCLRMGLYQIIYMDKVPDNAAVNETVNLVKNSKERYAAGFVNAILRAYLRNRVTLPEGDSLKALEVRFSCPKWFIAELTDYIGLESAKEYFESSLNIPPTYIRLNSQNTGESNVIETLESKNIKIEPTVLENAYKISGFSSVENLEEYKNGAVYVQDLASQLSINALAPKPGESLLDVCAAPGGKSLTAAQYMNNKGKILSCDLHPHRVDLIKASAKRMNLSIIDTRINDASKYNPNLGLFDKIICDVPCSGFGDIRRKPEIKYKNPNDLTRLPDLQYNILENSSEYLRPNGIIMYSTCTLRREENESTVERFLSRHTDFKLMESCVCGRKSGYHRLLTNEYDCDGFFFALLKKVGDGIG